MNWIWNGTLISQGALSEAPPAMADGYLIDTNVIWELRPAGQLYRSVPTLGEIRRSVEKAAGGRPEAGNAHLAGDVLTDQSHETTPAQGQYREVSSSASACCLASELPRLALATFASRASTAE